MGCSVLLVPLFVAANKPKETTDSLVDSGAFTILIKGQPVASETFTVQQKGGTSTIKSEIKEAGGAAQNSELQMTASGELVRYEWRELNPGKGQLLLVPNDQFLKETTTANPGDKP